jgi:hypothetical protein
MMDDQQRDRTAAAFARLQAVLAGLVREVEARAGERCPYRAADDACTFAGGCRNQSFGAGDAGVARCGGDHLLVWSPADDGSR